MNTITEEMFAMAHEKILEMGQENEEWARNCDLLTIREAVRGMTSFNLQDVKQKTGIADKNIEVVLDKMGEQG